MKIKSPEVQHTFEKELRTFWLGRENKFLQVQE
jgi:hypothetical protein